MRSEGVAEGVGGNVLVNFCKVGGMFYGFLHGGFVEVVAAGYSSTGVHGKFGSGEEVLPDPVFVCVLVFAFDGIGQVDGTESVSKVFFVKDFDVAQV